MSLVKFPMVENCVATLAMVNCLSLTDNILMHDTSCSQFRCDSIVLVHHRSYHSELVFWNIISVSGCLEHSPSEWVFWNIVLVSGYSGT